MDLSDLEGLKSKTRERVARRAAGSARWSVTDALKMRAARRRRHAMFSALALLGGAASALGIAAFTGLF